MKAALVFDGERVTLPPSFSEPCPDQMVGTEFERLGEVACRICYSSCGLDGNGRRRGRGSKELHRHILEVLNLSVYEHCVLTVSFPYISPDWYLGTVVSCINRKGVWIEDTENEDLEITANLRAILEWNRHTKGINSSGYGQVIKNTLLHFAHILAPSIVREEGELEWKGAVEKREGLSDDQAWISLWLEGSRGWSHEMIRHRFAMSQRSTRYVDESRSEYKTHPLVERYLGDGEENKADQFSLKEQIHKSVSNDQKSYILGVTLLEDYLRWGGVKGTAARKQARGAARGYLGNGLGTEMVFSAPISGWRWIFSQRLSRFADAEMRAVMADAYLAIQGSRYGERFPEQLVVSPDEIGMILE